MKTAPAVVLLSEDQIRSRVAELGRTISSDYRTGGMTIVGILKGSFIFLADLIRQIHPEIPIEVDFMSVSSYGDSTTSSGTVRIEKDLDIPVHDRDVLLVEDIVDTGLTLSHVHRILSGRGARSLRVVTLLEKPGKSKYERRLDYVGFQIPDQFVVGYGLDYAQAYRNLPDIRILNEV